MLRIRMVEEAIAKRYPDQEMRCPVHLCIGQEAPAVGVSAALSRDDRVLSSHRAHAHYLAKGGSLTSMIAEIHGKSTGCSGGIGGSMHLTDLSVNFMASTPVVGGTVPVAAGLAYGDQMSIQDRVTAVFFGDAVTEEGVWSETLNFAALHQLPLLLICENNLFSSQSPLSVRQAPQRDRVAIAKAHGMEAVRGDGNKVDQVLSLASKAVLRAKEGFGPTYLELDTYRWLEHCGPYDDTQLGYRRQEEINEWQQRCPLDYWKKTLDLEYSGLRHEIAEEIEGAFESAHSAPYPQPESLFKNVYAN
jgi:TPP-dependent pyruvate/acetoin dehydrogenase alpha subunit